MNRWVGSKPKIRARFLRELRDCSANTRTRVRKSSTLKTRLLDQHSRGTVRLVSLDQCVGFVMQVDDAPKKAISGGKMKQLSLLAVVVGALIGSMAWGQQPFKAAEQDATPWVLHDQNELSGVAVDLTRAIAALRSIR